MCIFVGAILRSNRSRDVRGVCAGAAEATYEDDDALAGRGAYWEDLARSEAPTLLSTGVECRVTVPGTGMGMGDREGWLEMSLTGSRIVGNWTVPTLRSRR